MLMVAYAAFDLSLDSLMIRNSALSICVPTRIRCSVSSLAKEGNSFARLKRNEQELEGIRFKIADGIILARAAK